ncbi:hypothetical protein BJY04DRAFT_220446 [Aspergillus karnatakaensis]|uniref:GIY-YIG nuclease family protein n=1 Tax=Aspergillus karnatakaensis TaxID=1810916 RepID=UPI003CCDA9F4
MSDASFVELRLLSAKCPSNTDWRCAALLSRGDRCEEQIPEDHAAKILGLHDELHDTNTVDSPSTLRASVLETLASLCLCEGHNEDEDITAAVVQWDGELRSRSQPAAPQTPIAKYDAEEKIIEFVSYTGRKYRIDPENPTDIDDNIRKILGGRIAKEDETVSYLYVFSRKQGNKGIYKVGLTENLTARRKRLEQCYGELELHCFVECPNIKLFEQLVHAELVQYRRQHQCKNTGCQNKTHTEWFETELHEILDTVMAWSLYARLLHRVGFSLDGNIQRTPVKLESRSNRWRKWALEESLRWMGQEPIKAPAISRVGPQGPQGPLFGGPGINEIQPKKEPDSETDSTVSSPGSFVDTPGATPDTTPLTTPGSFDGRYEDYSLSPTPGERYIKCESASVSGDDEDDGQDRSVKSVQRALFKSSKKERPRMRGRELSSEDLQSRESTRRIDPEECKPSPEEIHSRRLVDQKVRNILRSKPRSQNKGVIYLTPQHRQTGSHKIYIGSSGSKVSECYAQEEPYFRVECTDKLRVEKLVLADFGDRMAENLSCNLAGCNKKHKYWINAPGEDIKASIEAWTGLMKGGYDIADIPDEDFSRHPGRWTEWAKEVAVKNKNSESFRHPVRTATDLAKRGMQRVSTWRELGRRLTRKKSGESKDTK